MADIDSLLNEEEEVRGDWRKMDSEELHDLYSSSHQGNQIQNGGIGRVGSTHG
jgi:hypothetical protein